MVEVDLQARLEVRNAVEAMIQNLKPIAERKPEAPTKSDDFNALLESARRVFSTSATISNVSKVEGGTTLADLLVKLSILEGAIKADFTARNVAAAEAQNERNRQGRGSRGY